MLGDVLFVWPSCDCKALKGSQAVPTTSARQMHPKTEGRSTPGAKKGSDNDCMSLGSCISQTCVAPYPAATP